MKNFYAERSLQPGRHCRLIVIVPIAQLARYTRRLKPARIRATGICLVDSSTPCHNNESRVSWNVPVRRPSGTNRTAGTSRTDRRDRGHWPSRTHWTSGTHRTSGTLVRRTTICLDLHAGALFKRRRQCPSRVVCL
jgi:hypothetical protein